MGALKMIPVSDLYIEVFEQKDLGKWKAECGEELLESLPPDYYAEDFEGNIIYLQKYMNAYGFGLTGKGELKWKK